MQLSNMKISARLGLAFGIVVLTSMLSGGLSLSKLSAIQDNLEDIVKDNNAKIKLITKMSESEHVLARELRNLILLNDKGEKDAEMANIAKNRAGYDAAWADLEKLPASEKGQAIRAKIQAGRAVTRPLNDKVIELAMADKDDEASAVLLKQAAPAAQKWQDAIEENLLFQEANTELAYEQAQVAYASARTLMLSVNTVMVLLAVGLSWLVTRSITRQLGAEPGDAAQLARSVAAGDLSTQLRLRDGDTDSLMAQLLLMQQSLAKVVSSVRQNADSVATASAEIAQGNQDLSQRTEEQASALEETAASMEQLGSTVVHNADNAKQADQLAAGARNVAQQGGDVVGQVVETMRGINTSSKKISDIIGVIDGIAFQTNILALNAAVEAARAGEQGRGFAVVAGEVRNLAQRSADAAKEIKVLINASVEQVEKGTDLVDKAGATMREVVASIGRVSDIMGEINAASTEQSAGVAQVGEAVSQMDQTTQQNAALVEESAAAAESLRQQAQQLVQAVAVFKLSGLDVASHAAPAPHTAHRSLPKPIVRPTPLAPRAVKAPAVARAPAEPSASAPAARALATASADDDWTSF